MLCLILGTENNQTVTNDSTWSLIWDNFGNDFLTVLYYISLTILVFCLIVLFLRTCGFGTIGIVGGSFAAGFQSTHEIVKGSCFSCFQSLAMRLGRILIISAVISGVLLYGCIKIRSLIENSLSQNSTTPYNISSLNDSESSMFDTITLFGKNAIQSLSTLNASQAVSFIEDVSTNLASEVSEQFSGGENATTSVPNIASGLQSGAASQLLLLSLAMLYFQA